MVKRWAGGPESVGSSPTILTELLLDVDILLLYNEYSMEPEAYPQLDINQQLSASVEEVPSENPIKKYLVFIIIGFFLIFILIGLGIFVVLNRNQQDKPQITTDLSCNLTGQTVLTEKLQLPENVFISVDKTTLPSQEKQYIRVLHINPFIVEMIQPHEGSERISDTVKILSSEREKVKDLAFNDILEVTLYIYKDDSSTASLSMGTSIKNIKKVNKKDILAVPNSGTKTILYYADDQHGTALLSEEGIVYYRPINGSFKTKKLTTEDTTGLYNNIKEANINLISNQKDMSFPISNALLLLCNRYQHISSKNNPTIEPIIKKIHAFMSSDSAQLNYKLIFSKKFPIKDWKYSDSIPLDEVSNNAYIEKNKENLSKIMPPPDLIDEIGVTVGGSQSSYYRENNKIYGTFFDECKIEGQIRWSCFHAEELKLSGKIIQLPFNIPAELTTVPEKGIIIPSEEYQSHKEIYDQLIDVPFPDTLFFDQKNVYLQLRVYK